MKIYKKSLLYGAFALTLCMAGGCNSNIDLEPEGIITADGYFKSAEDYEKALTALYERLNVESYDLWICLLYTSDAADERSEVRPLLSRPTNGIKDIFPSSVRIT
mgnify:CR=1 FL=1